jgi:hypothetical protein
MAGAESGSLSDRRHGLGLPIEISAITAILALVLGLIAGAGAALYQRQRQIAYVSSAILFIDQPLIVATAPDAGPLQKLQLLRSQYTSLVKTDLIAGPASRQVNLPKAEVAGDLFATAPPLTFTITIAATAHSRSESGQIAQAAAAQLISYVAKSQAHLGIRPTARVVLTEPTAPQNGTRVPLSTSKVLPAALFAFLVVGGGFLIIADLLRRRE